ncbi:hypothetical protein D1007_26210 [Hordeum vulgare]|nr:hypothetical protein D1007_26210 [Hordeum vulgare]
MDDDIKAAAGLASLTSSGTASAGRGKPPSPRKTAAPPKKKELTPEERAVESAKRKGRRHAQDARAVGENYGPFHARAGDLDLNSMPVAGGSSSGGTRKRNARC